MKHILMAIALLAGGLVPALAGDAAKEYAGYRGDAGHARHCRVHRLPDGNLVDCEGWRKRDNMIGWDNSCHRLDYLPSQFACSGGGGGGGAGD